MPSPIPPSLDAALSHIIEEAFFNALRRALSERHERAKETRGEPPGPSNSPAKEPRLWTAQDVANFLKVSRSWVYKTAEAGKLPHRKVGGLLRFDAERVRRYASGDGR